MMHAHILNTLALASLAIAHGDHQQVPLSGPHKQLWYNTLPGDGGKQVGFGLTFDHIVKSSI
jgi:agmatinase